MLDTNAFISYASDHDRLTNDVRDLLLDYDNTLVMSIESLKELVIAYRMKRVLHTIWPTATDMVMSVETNFNVRVLPIDVNVMRTYSRLQFNVAQYHRHPSGHVIISHAITLGVPLVSSDRKCPFYRKQGLDLIENY